MACVQTLRLWWSSPTHSFLVTSTAHPVHNLLNLPNLRNVLLSEARLGCRIVDPWPGSPQRGAHLGVHSPTFQERSDRSSKSFSPRSRGKAGGQIDRCRLLDSISRENLLRSHCLHCLPMLDQSDMDVFFFLKIVSRLRSFAYGVKACSYVRTHSLAHHSCALFSVLSSSCWQR